MQNPTKKIKSANLLSFFLMIVVVLFTILGFSTKVKAKEDLANDIIITEIDNGENIENNVEDPGTNIESENIITVVKRAKNFKSGSSALKTAISTMENTFNLAGMQSVYSGMITASFLGEIKQSLNIVKKYNPITNTGYSFTETKYFGEPHALGINQNIKEESYYIKEGNNYNSNMYFTKMLNTSGSEIPNISVLPWTINSEENILNTKAINLYGKYLNFTPEAYTENQYSNFCTKSEMQNDGSYESFYYLDLNVKSEGLADNIVKYIISFITPTALNGFKMQEDLSLNFKIDKYGYIQKITFDTFTVDINFNFNGIKYTAVATVLSFTQNFVDLLSTPTISIPSEIKSSIEQNALNK